MTPGYTLCPLRSGHMGFVAALPHLEDGGEVIGATRDGKNDGLRLYRSPSIVMATARAILPSTPGVDRPPNSLI
jgi:hypothetical protein